MLIQPNIYNFEEEFSAYKVIFTCSSGQVKSLQCVNSECVYFSYKQELKNTGVAGTFYDVLVQRN